MVLLKLHCSVKSLSLVGLINTLFSIPALLVKLVEAVDGQGSGSIHSTTAPLPLRTHHVSHALHLCSHLRITTGRLIRRGEGGICCSIHGLQDTGKVLLQPVASESRRGVKEASSHCFHHSELFHA